MVTKTKRDVRGVEFVWGGAINVLCSETENQLTSLASESLCGQFQQHNIAKGNQVTYDTIDISEYGYASNGSYETGTEKTSVFTSI